jgi:hypothetical protein
VRGLDKKKLWTDDESYADFARTAAKESKSIQAVLVRDEGELWIRDIRIAQ